jgi:hypothetical protein
MAAPAPAPAAPTTAESVIPDAGVYGAQSAAALNAYNNATAQAAAQRNQLYNQYGLTNSGQVDINNQGGQYQQMLGAQGQQFNADQQDARAAASGARWPRQSAVGARPQRRRRPGLRLPAAGWSGIPGLQPADAGCPQYRAG